MEAVQLIKQAFVMEMCADKTCINFMAGQRTSFLTLLTNMFILTILISVLGITHLLLNSNLNSEFESIKCILSPTNHVLIKLCS